MSEIAAAQGVRYEYMESPIGPLMLARNDAGLTHIYFHSEKSSLPRTDWRQSWTGLEEAREQLAAYFAGQRECFDLPLAARGTPFQQQVWKALREIPCGVTISYGELARRIGQPTAARAVGAANGQNPLAIVVPCHRVIGSNGTLTGYAGGLSVKQALLEHEARYFGKGQGELGLG